MWTKKKYDERQTGVKNRDSARVIGGLILLGVGAALSTFVKGLCRIASMAFTCPMIVILAGIYQGVKHNFSLNRWITTIGVGFFF